MQLAQTVEYALRAVVWLAQHRDTPQTTSQIAEATKMPPSYLSKVLQALGRADLVSGQRGLHGGFSLQIDPADLTILQVVNAVEPVQRIRICPLGIDSHGSNLCALHQALDDAMAQVERCFAEQTIGQLMAEQRPSQPLCELTVSPKPAV